MMTHHIGEHERVFVNNFLEIIRKYLPVLIHSYANNEALRYDE